MVNEQIRIGGAVVFWKMGPEFSRDALRASLAEIGMEDYCPEERPDSQCLKEALAGTFEYLVKPGLVVMVNPLKEKGAFEVVTMEKGEDQNDYRQVCWGRASEKDGLRLYGTNGHSEEVRNRFAARKAIVTGAQVSQGLITMLEDRQSVCLRPSGGVYWIPAKLSGWWACVSKAIEGCGGDKTAVYNLSTVHNPDMVRAVTDGIAAETVASLAAIEKELTDGTLGETALRTRVRMAADLRDKLKSYETFLSTSLAGLHEAVDRTENAAAMATLAAAAEAAGAIV